MNQSLTLQELRALGAALLKPAALSELALFVASLGIAWLLVRLLQGNEPRLRRSVLFGSTVLNGALFPLLALLQAYLLRRFLLPFLGLPLAVFKLVIPVLVSLAVIRLSARVMSATLPESIWVKIVERSVSWMAWGGSILWITGLWPLAMDELDDISWKVGATRMTLRSVIEGGLTSAFVLGIALWISSVIETRLLRESQADLSLRKMAANMTRSILLLLGLILALTASGIDLTALGVLGGALGVGIGFGLQKLAANYVSGFVILAERSLRIGDMVKVDGFDGRISDIKTRYTVIRALNGREAIVPNELLITQRVENSSLADPRVLLSTVVQVGYGSDLSLVMPRLAAAVEHVNRVLSQPAPMVQLSQFAADGLELQIYFWIADPENGAGGVKSEVNLAILRTLTEMDVEIPFPQRVLHRSVPRSKGS